MAFHPEYEIVLVTESVGQRFIGEHMQDFKAGDLCFIGPNVPHLYRNTEDYYKQNADLKAKSIVIHFNEDFLGKDFFNIPEMQHVKVLFEKSLKVLDIFGETNAFIAARLKEMFHENATKRLLSLLEILDFLGKSNEYQLLTSGDSFGTNIKDAERVNRVFEYVMKNFRNEIRLDEAADLVAMSETSFSRYFKSRTNKSFSDFVSQIRIAHACKLLIDCKMTVSEIAFESGFNNLSNFNRQFKEQMNITPSSYQKQILQK
ncbi:AraC family transcriptional regulator [Pseudarcicella hirudinis]|uniref:AraC family transcriptional regulator n=1 Tax=Pseudarcicella hirudinis TaxID=1079859 RepID=UPI0035F02405